MRELDHGRPGVVWTPRPDLSGQGQDVMEFRIRSHDGVRLWGLFARPAWRSGPWSARVRAVGPAERPSVDAATAQGGEAELVFQEPPGRRLSDRVLDVVQVCRLALGTDGIDQVEIQAPTQSENRCADELLIAGQLLSNR
ncbi:MAG: hypothetical protein AAGA20_14150, partial [Planctomycetota bacterium]